MLAPHGSLYLHVDWRTSHHVRLLLDEVFGPERFLNEIVWAYDYGGRARDRWPRKHDTILWYAKGDTWLFERDAIDRLPYLAPGLVGPEKAARGKLPTDVWWMTIVPPGSAERTGYPTQKPVRLLERIVAASSRPGDLVLDPYAGSGTTGVAAARLGRRWLLVDRNPEAVAIAARRLAAEAGVTVDGADEPPDEPRRLAATRIAAITLDFGNTLVPVPPRGCAGSSRDTARAMADRLGPFAVDEVLRVWDEERARQFREEVPAVPRGRPRPARWSGCSPGCGGCRPRRRTSAGTTPRPAAERPGRGRLGGRRLLPRLRRALAAGPGCGRAAARASPRRYRLAILSNWPLAATIDRYVEVGRLGTVTWRAVVVSQRVGVDQAAPGDLRRGAARALGDPPRRRSCTSATTGRPTWWVRRRAGWRAAYLGARPARLATAGGAGRDTVGRGQT